LRDGHVEDPPEFKRKIESMKQPVKIQHGPSNRVLEVDLTSGVCQVIEVSSQDRRMYLGGKGLGLKLIYERMPVGIDPLGEENILALMPGVLMGTGAPNSGRFAAVTKSPLTGIMASASCGGPFGMQLKKCGWDGLLVRGAASSPTLLVITPEGAELESAEELWGKDTVETQEMISEKRPGGALVIGPAGENRVRFANIVSAQRFLGRGGMGAVMGAKKLKGIVATNGFLKIRPVDAVQFDAMTKRARTYIKGMELTSEKYPNYGTNSNVNVCNAAEILPVNNFKDGHHELAFEVSGEVVAERHNIKHHTCKPCSILCGHKGTFEKKQLPVPEYETTGLLGTNLGIFDANRIAEWNWICTRMGMDTISAGGTLAWVMEATEKGLVSSDLKFGCADGISQALEDIAECRGFCAEIAQGSRSLAAKYGGSEFAMQVKGLELPAYDPRGAFGHGLGYAVANRGACHLSAFVAGLEVFFGLLNPYTIRAKAEWVKFFGAVSNGVNSLHTCMFASYAYMFESPLTKHTPRPILGFLMQYLPNLAIWLTDVGIMSGYWSAVTGIKVSTREFLEAGTRINTLERYMNTREGISRKDDTLPVRLLTEPRASDSEKHTVPIEKMLESYYKISGYDSNGVPTADTLKKLGIT